MEKLNFPTLFILQLVKSLRPEKSTSSWRSLPVYTIIGSIPRVLYTIMMPEPLRTSIRSFETFFTFFTSLAPNDSLITTTSRKRPPPVRDYFTNNRFFFLRQILFQKLSRKRPLLKFLQRPRPLFRPNLTYFFVLCFW